jgi:hypothetical protein
MYNEESNAFSPIVSTHGTGFDSFRSNAPRGDKIRPLGRIPTDANVLAHRLPESNLVAVATAFVLNFNRFERPVRLRAVRNGQARFSIAPFRIRSRWTLRMELAGELHTAFQT